MRKSQIPWLATLIGLVATSSLAADEVRYFQQNGVTYRETRRTVQRPVYKTEMRQQTQTCYRQEQTSETRPVTQTQWTPVRECRWEPVWIGRWNPFITPYVAYRPQWTTRWEANTETVERPVTTTRWVPETRTVQVPVTVRETVPEEVVSRVPIGGPGPVSSFAGTTVGPPVTTSPRSTSPGTVVGGVAQLKNDPPREGVRAAWRPSTTR